MKREYSRPSIHVESMKLDTVIAATNCTVEKADMMALQRWGYFAPDLGCGIYVENLRMGYGYDTVCYHSNVRTVLSS